jgi:hypothetical protein
VCPPCPLGALRVTPSARSAALQWSTSSHDPAVKAEVAAVPALRGHGVHGGVTEDTRSCFWQGGRRLAPVGLDAGRGSRRRALCSGPPPPDSSPGEHLSRVLAPAGAALCALRAPSVHSVSPPAPAVPRRPPHRSPRPNEEPRRRGSERAADCRARRRSPSGPPPRKVLRPKSIGSKTTTAPPGAAQCALRVPSVHSVSPPSARGAAAPTSALPPHLTAPAPASPHLTAPADLTAPAPPQNRARSPSNGSTVGPVTQPCSR